MSKTLFFVFCFFCIIKSNAQNISINNAGLPPHASAMMDVSSLNKGVLIPRVNLTSTSDVSTIHAPAVSLLVYNTNTSLPDGAGYYYWENTGWKKLYTRVNIDSVTWKLGGNSGTNELTHFIGTTDNKPLFFRVNNIMAGKIDGVRSNVSFGRYAGNALTTGDDNSFFGDEAGKATTTGDFNTFVGGTSGLLNTTGSRNVFVGKNAGWLNKTGSTNVFVGADAGAGNTTGTDNVFLGNKAGFLYRSAKSNIAIGAEALGDVQDTTKGFNIAIGYQAGYNSNSGRTGNLGSTNQAGIYIGTAAGYNGEGGIAIGDSASHNFSDYRNIAIGVSALKDNVSGVLDIGIGLNALAANTTGKYNLAVGQFALRRTTSGEFNVGIGNNAISENTTGNNNTSLGAHSGTTVGASGLSNTTAIGYSAKVSTSNTQVFGNGEVDRWAFGITTTSANHALEVGFNATNGNGAFLTEGGNWVNTSDRNRKEAFSNLDRQDLLRKIQQLSITRWRYKGTNEYHIGPVAQDFYRLFNVGVDEKGISTVDPSGIALAAIQELIQQNEMLKKRIQSLERKLVKRNK